MNVGSLFAGIGGFDLGLERAGMRTVWFCEQDDYCRRVLNRHWPGVPVYPDVRSLVADATQLLRDGGNHYGRSDSEGRAPLPEPRNGSGADGVPGQVSVQVPPVDVLCGGFPCQDISTAGRGAGIEGSRSGLWSEYARLIGELRPRYVIVENVPALLGRGLGRVLGDLAALGYDAEWDCLPASAFGAPHRRDRIWIVAYPGGEPGGLAEHPHTAVVGPPGPGGPEQPGYPAAASNGEAVEPVDGGVPDLRATESGMGRMVDGISGGLDGGQWDTEPDIPRVATGVPNRVQRLSALGNALVPQIAEWIGQRIMENRAE